MPELKFAIEQERDRLDVLTTWLPRIAITMIFLSIGSEKFGSHGPWIRIFARVGLGDWFRYLTGVLQVGGALLVLVPPTTTIGAAVLGCTMVGAVIVNVFILHTGFAAIIPAALLGAIVSVGWKSATASR
jgi:putative oxidoreductase